MESYCVWSHWTIVRRMRESFPVKLLLQLLQATPEQLVAIEGILCGGKAESRKGTQTSPSSLPGPEREGARFVFRRTGRRWEVVFCGGRAFRLRNTLGARYLDHVLHEPNEPVRAFDLEVEVQPEKGEAQAKESIQPESDPRAKRQYREELQRLQAERRRAKKAGDPARVPELDLDIKKLNAALNKRRGIADTGERARGNVTQALAAARRRLARGNRWERAFAEHLSRFLSLGYQCMYTQAEGEIWK